MDAAFNPELFPHVEPFLFDSPLGAEPPKDYRALAMIEDFMISDLAKIVNEYCQLEHEQYMENGRLIDLWGIFRKVILLIKKTYQGSRIFGSVEPLKKVIREAGNQKPSQQIDFILQRVYFQYGITSNRVEVAYNCKYTFNVEVNHWKWRFEDERLEREGNRRVTFQTFSNLEPKGGNLGKITKEYHWWDTFNDWGLSGNEGDDRRHDTRCKAKHKYKWDQNFGEAQCAIVNEERGKWWIHDGDLRIPDGDYRKRTPKTNYKLFIREPGEWATKYHDVKFKEWGKRGDIYKEITGTSIFHRTAHAELKNRATKRRFSVYNEF